jgi:hypothetical protein
MVGGGTEITGKALYWGFRTQPLSLVVDAADD